MATIHDAYVGVADEVTYGTGVAVNNFFEFISESIEGKYERIESEGLRSGSRTLRSDRFVPNAKGAEGELEFEVLDKGFDFWLKYLLGGVATSGAGPITTTATVGSMAGKSFTLQVGRPAVDGTNHPFTYEGGKVVEWELSNEVDGVLKLTLNVDAAKETAGAGAGAYALATPTYPATAQLMTFQGGTATIAASQFDVKETSVKHESGLKTDRYFTRGASSTIKKEPMAEGFRNIEFELKGEFENLTHYNRVVSASAAGALAAVVLNWSSPQGGTLVVTLPAARFDGATPQVGGMEIVEQTLSGKCLDPGSGNGPISVAYTPPA